MTDTPVGGEVAKGWELVGNTFRDSFSALDDDPGVCRPRCEKLWGRDQVLAWLTRSLLPGRQ